MKESFVLFTAALASPLTRPAPKEKGKHNFFESTANSQSRLLRSEEPAAGALFSLSKRADANMRARNATRRYRTASDRERMQGQLVL